MQTLKMVYICCSVLKKRWFNLEFQIPMTRLRKLLSCHYMQTWILLTTIQGLACIK